MISTPTWLDRVNSFSLSDWNPAPRRHSFNISLFAQFFCARCCNGLGDSQWRLYNGTNETASQKFKRKLLFFFMVK